MDDLIRTESGLIKTGKDTAVSESSLSEAGLKQAQQFALSAIPTPTPTPTTQSNISLPQPTAPKVEETFVESLSGQVDTARKQLDDTFKTQKAEVDKKLEEATIAQQGFIANTDPTTRPTFEQETRVLQNQLDAAEAASKTLETNFNEKQRLVNELETLLTEGNAFIKAQRGPGSVPTVVSNARQNRAIQDVAARTGVIQAVLSARDGQIAQAHNIINQSKDTIAARWNDHLNYYQTLLDYNNQKIVSLDKESKAIAEKQVGLIERDLARVEQTTDYLRELMTDPQTAQFIADAGVKLTDSVEQVNAKMAQQSRVEEIKTTTNDLIQDGYKPVGYNAPGSVPIQAGGKTLYFTPPKKGVDDGGGSEEPLSINQIEQFRRSYGWTPPFGYTEAQLLSYMADNPNATPEELEAGARQVTDSPTEPQTTEPQEITDEFISDIVSSLDDDQLKALKKKADDANISSFFRGKKTDVKNYLNSIKDKIQTALDQGYSQEEIVTFLAS